MGMRILGLGLAVLLSLPGMANATLVLSGDGLTVHDDVTNLDWLQDANANSAMTWAVANTWAAGLTVGGFSDWRLPTTLQPDSSCGSQSTASGFPDQGFGIGCTGSEMGNLFNVAGVTAAAPSPFSNVQSNVYWSGTEFAPNTGSAWVFDFRFGSGFQSAFLKNNFLFAWAVRSGDVAASAPEPGTIVLLGLGLAGIGVSKRSKRRL